MKKFYVVLLSILLSSCASLRYGNFTDVSKNKDAYLANDVIAQLTKIYPPARNTFLISQRVTDNFGVMLIQGMRQKGYGVIENIRPRNKANFFYVVDGIKPYRQYRVTIFIDNQSLSRAYATTNGKLTPISPWSHKE